MATLHTMLFRYDEKTRQALEAIKTRDGVPFQEQMRRALLLWFDTKEMPVEVSPRRAALIARAARLMEEA